MLTAIRISDVIGDAVELDRGYSALFVIGVLDRIVSATELGEEIANKKTDRRSGLEKSFLSLGFLLSFFFFYNSVRCLHLFIKNV